MVGSHLKSCKRGQGPGDGRLGPWHWGLLGSVHFTRNKINSTSFKSLLEVRWVPFSFVTLMTLNTEYIRNWIKLKPCAHQTDPGKRNTGENDRWETRLRLAAKALSCWWRFWRETWIRSDSSTSLFWGTDQISLKTGLGVGVLLCKKYLVSESNRKTGRQLASVRHGEKTRPFAPNRWRWQTEDWEELKMLNDSGEKNFQRWPAQTMEPPLSEAKS